MKTMTAMALIGTIASIPVQAGAETLRVNGVYPANFDLPGNIEILSIAPFGGDAGAEAEFAITDRLGRVSINGERYFRIKPDDGFGSNETDAILRGSVQSEIFEERARPRIVTRCIKRDDDKKCIEEKTRRIPCWNLTLRMDPRIFLTAYDGTPLYSHRTSEYETAHYCRNDVNFPSEIDMGNRLIERIAQRVRVDLAPRQFSHGYRIMERRKGLNKADRKAFKQAIRLTKTSADDACDAFGALYQSNPNHISVVYNMGLCAEAIGNLSLAQQFYADARAINAGHSYHREGTGRITARYRANAQLAAREGNGNVFFGAR